MASFQCPDCNHSPIEGEYNYALHRGFKHNDWSALDRYYEKIGLPKELWFHGRAKLSTLKNIARLNKALDKYVPTQPQAKQLLFERKWKCSMCDEPKIYDPQKKTLTCGCGTIKGYDISDNMLRAYFRKTFCVEAI